MGWPGIHRRIEACILLSGSCRIGGDWTETRFSLALHPPVEAGTTHVHSIWFLRAPGLQPRAAVSKYSWNQALMPTQSPLAWQIFEANHESARFPASEWLDLCWLGSHQGVARPGGYPDRQSGWRTFEVVTRVELLKPDGVEPHLAAGAADSRHALSKDNFDPLYGRGWNGKAEQGQAKRSRDRVREVSRKHQAGADADQPRLAEKLLRRFVFSRQQRRPLHRLNWTTFCSPANTCRQTAL